MSHDLKRIYIFSRYFEVCKLHWNLIYSKMQYISLNLHVFYCFDEVLTSKCCPQFINHKNVKINNLTGKDVDFSEKLQWLYNVFDG